MKKIAIVSNADNDKDLVVTKRFEARLGDLPCTYKRVCSAEEIDKGTDMVLVFGGDGTILRVAHAVAHAEIPVLGVNLGKVGYMAELEPDEDGLLYRYFDGEYSIDERMMLSATDNQGVIHEALNDAVITFGESTRLVTLALSCDGEDVSSYYGNGLIVATPTGSTAYSLSAGGPVISPKHKCIAVTPICSHSLTDRPIIFEDDCVLKITNISAHDSTAVLNVDGVDVITVPGGESVTIKKSHLTTKFIRLKNDGFYAVLGKKIRK